MTRHVYPPRVADGGDRFRRILRSLPLALSVLVVLAVYAFFAGDGRFDFRRLGSWQESIYASLARGFFRGQLNLDHWVNPKLVALPYPYEPKAREGIHYEWDTSYLNGKYYLYSSPLPAILGYMPLRILRRGYPPDSFVALFFCAWAFLVSVAFLRRALKPPLNVPLPLWVLFIGLGNVIAFVLVTVHMYEVAIVCGMAMTATWALALLRYNESPTPRRAAWLGLWLALSIAARPNLGVLLFVMPFVIQRTRKTIIAVLAPLAIVAMAMLWYNVARFGDPFEFGVRYQLTGVDMNGRKVCSLCTFPELARFGNNMQHYLFWPLHMHSKFPFVDAMPARVDRAVSWPTPNGMTEQIVGIAPIAPLMMLGALFAIVLGLMRGPKDVAMRTALQLTAGAWLIVFGLSTCWWLVARYSLDFMMLMSVASVVCIETIVTSLRLTTIRIAPLRALVAALACYSIITAVLLGFAGPGDGFRRANPKVFERVSGWFQ